MTQTRVVTETEQDELLLRIHAIAIVQAEKNVRSGYREDIVHDVLLQCLEALRAGTFNPDIGNLDDWVKRCLRNHAVDNRRRRRALMERDGAHLTEIDDAPREWMSQELKLEEDRLRDFANRIFKTLPEKCVVGHHLVREDQETYAEAGKKLGVSDEAIHKYVGTVQRAFRNALPTIGITPPPSVRGGRLSRNAKARTRWRARRRKHRDAGPGRVNTSGGSLTRQPEHVDTSGDSLARQPGRPDLPGGCSPDDRTASTRHAGESTDEPNASTRRDNAAIDDGIQTSHIADDRLDEAIDSRRDATVSIVQSSATDGEADGATLDNKESHRGTRVTTAQTCAPTADPGETIDDAGATIADVNDTRCRAASLTGRTNALTRDAERSARHVSATVCVAGGTTGVANSLDGDLNVTTSHAGAT